MSNNKHNINNTKDLAVLFYNHFLDNGGDILDPDSESHKLMGEINNKLEELVGIQQTMQIEDKILRLNCIDCEQHFVWGFESCLELCQAVYGREFIEEALNQLLYK